MSVISTCEISKTSVFFSFSSVEPHACHEWRLQLRARQTLSWAAHGREILVVVGKSSAMIDLLKEDPPEHIGKFINLDQLQVSE